jgi:hypothetical protein
MVIEKGDKVKLKRKDYGKGLGVRHVMNGGEAVVLEVYEDRHGLVIRVELARNGRIHSVRRSDVVIRRKSKDSVTCSNSSKTTELARQPRRQDLLILLLSARQRRPHQQVLPAQ